MDDVIIMLQLVVSLVNLATVVIRFLSTMDDRHSHEKDEDR